MNPTRLRADAAGNRARIIAAARAAIADAGEVKLNAIARQAGVGQGTLYRHFPTREDLLAEVYREDVDELVAAAPALLAEHEPLTALACWFDRVASYARIKRGVFAAVEAGVSQALAAHSLGPIGEAITVLLDAGKADRDHPPRRRRPGRHPPHRLPDPPRAGRMGCQSPAPAPGRPRRTAPPRPGPVAAGSRSGPNLDRTGAPQLWCILDEGTGVPEAREIQLRAARGPG